MNRWMRRACIGVTLLVLSVALAGCTRGDTLGLQAGERGPETKEAAHQNQAPTAPAEPREIVITANEWRFEPAAFQLTAGQPIRLVLENEGKLVHDITISDLEVEMHAAMEGAQEDGAAGPKVDGRGEEARMHNHDEVPTAGDHAANNEVHGNGAAVHVHADPGETDAVEFTPTESGTYQFVCTLPGHKEAGMVGKLTVGAAHGG